MVVYLPVYQTCPLVVRWRVNLYTIRQDTNQLLNQQSLIRSVCRCQFLCTYVYVHGRGRWDVFNDYWLMEGESCRKQTGWEGEKRKEMRNSGMEQGGDLLLLTVNNTGRHFNYHQPAQMNLYCPLDKDTCFVWISLQLWILVMKESLLQVSYFWNTNHFHTVACVFFLSTFKTSKIFQLLEDSNQALKGIH